MIYSEYECNKNKYEQLAREYESKAIKTKVKRLGIRVLAFADTHYSFMNHKEMSDIYEKYPTPDLVLLMGDHGNGSFINILRQYFDSSKIAGVLGNHDAKNLYRDFSMKELHGDVVEIDGIRIAGISGSHAYKNSRDYYMLLTQEESLEVANELLEKAPADIFISHDKAYAGRNIDNIDDIVHCGLLGATRYVYEAAPALHVHGHLHCSCQKEYSNGTKEISIYGVEYLIL